MRIAIATPLTSIASTGNLGTANQWATFLREMGHDVSVGGPDMNLAETDLLIALHGWKSQAVIEHFDKGQLVVALTGTDIYPAPNETVLKSIAKADRLIVYQKKAIEKVPPKQRKKIRVIPQSAKPVVNPKKTDPDHFDVCVVGHLRDVKDPMRTAEAARRLPEKSRVRILHAGGILDEKYRDRVEQEKRENPRYHFLGELDAASVGDLVARSRAMVVSSFSEGGARVAGQALVNFTPVISSKIDGIVGLVGTENYPGFFPAGDTAALTNLLNRFESDADFRSELQSWAKKLAPNFTSETEKKLLGDLVAELHGAADQSSFSP